jgi:hypothetical protein
LFLKQQPNQTTTKPKESVLKNQTKHLSIMLAFLALTTLNIILPAALAQGTAFTYQGRLNNSSGPVSGAYDVMFTLFSTNITGSAIAGPITNSAIAVSNGLFTTPVDFGAGVFSSTGSNWLEIAVRATGSGSFSTLAPRQQLTPTPYAISAENLASVIQNNTITPGSFNTVGGGFNNYSLGGGSVVAGGADNYSAAVYSTVSGGYFDSAGGNYATVGGGYENVASGQYATVGGGSYNIASQTDATTSGGDHNTNSATYSTISGGQGNYTAGGGYATICGGALNVATGFGATVAGGELNIASGSWSFAAGNEAQALHTGSFVWADSSGGFASTAVNQFAVHANGGARFVTGSAGLTLGSSGQYYAPGGQENLRIVRGVLSATGSIIVGSGFTAAHSSTGVYTITFTTAFPSAPAANATADSGGGNARVAMTDGVTGSVLTIRVMSISSSPANTDAPVHFIAMGPQ